MITKHFFTILVFLSICFTACSTKESTTPKEKSSSLKIDRNINLSSEENIKKVIKQCYTNYLKRNADDAGLNAYLNLFKTNKLTTTNFEKRLVNSPEYKINFINNRTPIERVKYLLHNITGNNPDKEEIKSLEALNNNYSALVNKIFSNRGF